MWIELLVLADVSRMIDGETLARPEIELISACARLVPLAEGLPAVDQPELELRVLRQEPLVADAREIVRREIGDERMQIVAVLLRKVALKCEIRGEDAAFDVHAMQRAEMPACRRLLHRRKRAQREELAAQRSGVLAPEGVAVRSGLQIEAADGTAQVGDLDAERDEIDGDLIVPGSRRGQEDGVVLGLGELERVIGVDEDGAGDRPPFEQRAGLTIGAVEPAPVAVAVGRLPLIERPRRSSRGP